MSIRAISYDILPYTCPEAHETNGSHKPKYLVHTKLSPAERGNRSMRYVISIPNFSVVRLADLRTGQFSPLHSRNRVGANLSVHRPPQHDRPHLKPVSSFSHVSALGRSASRPLNVAFSNLPPGVTPDALDPSILFPPPPAVPSFPNNSRRWVSKRVLSIPGDSAGRAATFWESASF